MEALVAAPQPGSVLGETGHVWEQMKAMPVQRLAWLCLEECLWRPVLVIGVWGFSQPTGVWLSHPSPLVFGTEPEGQARLLFVCLWHLA